MVDERPNGKSARRALSSALLAELRMTIAAYVDPVADDDDIARRLHTIGEQARAEGIRAEQLVTSIETGLRCRRAAADTRVTGCPREAPREPRDDLRARVLRVLA